MMAERQLCTFRVGGLLIGLDIDRVQEVLSDPVITSVPLAPPAVAGLLNLRGQILAVIDGRARLGLPRGDVSFATHVIVRARRELVSLAVDTVDSVRFVDAVDIEDVPTTLSDAIRACAVGARPLDGDVLIVLDADLVLALAT
jgi:purine-binding chemotaxis protein CheW